MDSVRIKVELALEDAQALYAHTGTMPYTPWAWTHRVRAAVSEGLATAPRCGVYVSEEANWFANAQKAARECLLSLSLPHPAVVPENHCVLPRGHAPYPSESGHLTERERGR